MNGAELKAWRKANGYNSQAALQMELELGSRATLSSWENSKGELPRLIVLALTALERCPELKTVTGKRKTGSVQINTRNKFETT